MTNRDTPVMTYFKHSSNSWHLILNLFSTCFATSTCLAYTTIEPPVTLSRTEIVQKNNPIKFNYSAEVHSQLRWQGVPLTSGLPGWASKASIQYKRGLFDSFIDLNGYAYTANPPSTNTQSVDTDIAYMMTEGRMGTQFAMGSSDNSRKLRISRGIYMWPGSDVWQYRDLSCTGSSSSYLQSQNPIKPVRSMNIELDLSGLIMSYSTYTVSNKNASSTVSNQPLSTSIWAGDYFHLQTKHRKLSRDYSYNFEYGYWTDTGRHIDLNLRILFDQSMQSVLKGYTFNTQSTALSDSYGVVFIMKYLMQ